MLRILLNKLWLLVAILLVLVASAVSLGRVLTPELPKYRGAIEQRLSADLGLPVHIGAMQARWALSGPVLKLDDLMLGNTGDADNLRIAQVDLALDVWRSALKRQAIVRRLSVRGARGRLDRDSTGLWRLHGLPESRTDTPLASIVDFLLAQRFLSVSDSRLLLFQPDKPALPVRIRELSLSNTQVSHQLFGEAFLEGGEGDSIRFVAETGDDPRAPDARTRVYLASRGQWLPSLPLPRLEGFRLERAGVDGELWAEREGRRWTRVQARIRARELRLARAAGAVLNISELSGVLRWQRQSEGWRLDGNRLRVRWPEATTEAFDLSLAQGAGGLDGGLSGLELAPLANYVLPWLPLAKDARERVAALALSGSVHDVFWHYQAPAPQDGAVLPRWQLVAQAADLAWKATAGLPAVSGLDGAIAADQDGGTALVRRLATADLKPMFREPMAFTGFKAGLQWRRAGDDWQLSVPGVELRTADLGLAARLVLDHPAQGPAQMSLYGELRDAETGAAARYYPVSIMSSHLVHYLETSVGAGGKVKFAQVAVRGPLLEFPFENPDGVFSIAARAEGIPFRFQPDWPVLENTGVDLYFQGDSMRIVADTGVLKGLRVKSAEALIPRLSAVDASLDIRASAQGDGQAVTAVVRDSPLPTLVGPVLARMDLSGPSTVAVNLKIPLEHADDTRVDGYLDLEQARFGLPGLNPLLTEFQGRLAFSEHGAHAEGMKARLFGGPAVLDLKELKTGGRSRLQAIGRGRIDMAVLKSFGFPLAGQIRGETGYTAVLNLEPQSDGGVKPMLSVTSDLKGVSIDLPPPLKQDPASGGLFSAELAIGDELELTGRYQDLLTAHGRWLSGENGYVFERLSLHGGHDMPPLPTEPGLHIDGRFPALAARDWIDGVPVWFPEAQAGDSVFKDLDIAIGALDLYGLAIPEARVELKPVSDGLDIGVIASTLTGRMQWPLVDGKPVVLDIARADLPALASGPEPGTGEPTGGPEDIPLQPRELPPLVVSCKDCRYAGHNLGAVSLITQPNADGMEIREFSLASASTALKLSGQWQGGETERTSLRGTLNSPDVGKFAKDWRLAFSARESAMKVDFELAWPGDPLQFGWAHAKGFINGKLSQGHLEDVSDQGARVFSLLSLQSLRRRLSLDFSDVYKKGFFYSSISGSFQIRDGIASTDNTVIDGLAANVEISGHTDLVNQTLDQKMSVAPKVSSSLPILAGWAVEPTMALVALAVNTVLQPALEVFTRIDYRITGPWENPVLEEVGKTKAKVVPPAPSATGASEPGTANPATKPGSQPEAGPKNGAAPETKSAFGSGP